MFYSLKNHGSDRAMRCAVCGGKFGLSRNCVDRLKARRHSDYNWMVGSKSPSIGRPKTA